MPAPLREDYRLVVEGIQRADTADAQLSRKEAAEFNRLMGK